MNLYGNPPRAIAGQKYGLQDVVESHVASENIEPGKAVFGKVGDDSVFNAHKNAVTLVGSAEGVASNSLAVTVNGVELAAVPFDTDMDTTLAAVVEAINGNETLSAAGIAASTVAGSKSVIVTGDSDVTASIVVTGGASQPTFTATATTDMKFAGVAVHEELCFKEGVGFYPEGIPVNVMTHGKIYAPVAEGASPADKKAAYVVLSGDDAGKFTDDSSGTYDCGCVFRSDEQNGLALVEVNGLK